MSVVSCLPLCHPMSLYAARNASASSSASSGVVAFASSLASCIPSQSGREAASLLSLSDVPALPDRYSFLEHSTVRFDDSPYLSECMRAFRAVDYESGGTSPWSGIASRHLAAASHCCRKEVDEETGEEVQKPDWERAYAAQLEIVKSFIPWFQDSSLGSTSWALPILYTLCADLKSLATQADKELVRIREKATKLEEASRLITKGWTACLNDRTPAQYGVQKRNLGTYYMATLLFKIYFRLETLGLCKNIVRGIQNQADLPPLSDFPMSHQVTYRYYLGVFAFLNERYGDAERELSFAFEHCHRRAYKNQERILSYLVPLRMLRGVLPSSLLLDNFPRLASLYRPFVVAYRTGDLKAYDDALLSARGALVRRGSFLVIERAREGCLRQLFKKVWLCSGKGSRLLVETVQRALAHVSVDIDSDEVECLLANLIYKGHLKGYISHERQTVVLAKDKPFPDIIGKALAV